MDLQEKELGNGNVNLKNKPQWYYRQSGVIPFRKDGNRLEILLITSRNQKKWIVPKGIVDPGKTPSESALMEANEEAGIDGNLFPEPVGEITSKKWGGTIKIKLYLMEVTTIHSDWPEQEIRERRWFKLDEAKKIVSKKQLRELLSSVPKIVNKTAF